MKTPKVWVFFYGSYINFDVLKEVDLVPGTVEIAQLYGFDITIQPLANIYPSERNCVYGIIATATHQELQRLYVAHAEKILGGVYLPEAVIAQTTNGTWRPALCYIAHDMKKNKADPAYVDRIADPAKKFGFPEWYVQKLESFKQ